MSVRSIAERTGITERRRAGRGARSASAATVGHQPSALEVWLTGRSMHILEGALALTAMATALLLGAGR